MEETSRRLSAIFGHRVREEDVSRFEQRLYKGSFEPRLAEHGAFFGNRFDSLCFNYPARRNQDGYCRSRSAARGSYRQWRRQQSDFDELHQVFDEIVKEDDGDGDSLN